MKLPDKVKEDVVNVYKIIADAESKAHGVPVGEVHFHEVGMLDAIMDISAFCLAMHYLEVDEVLASPVCVGYGTVNTQHGLLPVPAPATEFILEGIPTYPGDVEGELCTPTGAALLKYFVTKFTKEKPSVVTETGYGFGKKELDKPNYVKALLTEEPDENSDVIYILQCNLDDMTGEAIGRATQKILDAGARDVYVSPVYMKKNRPGFELTVLVSPDKKQEITAEIFKHTSTIGLRESKSYRQVLSREEKTHDTDLGKVREKISEGFGVVKRKLEYEDLNKIANEINVSLEEARNIIEATLLKED